MQEVIDFKLELFEMQRFLRAKGRKLWKTADLYLYPDLCPSNFLKV
jgi:hypothetical protein